jgi:lysozyme
MPFVKGIDVSIYDPVVNWAKVRAQGYRFVYVRASYGVENKQTLMDAMFPSHWAGAKNAGMLRGAYHYLRAAQDGAKQAAEFLKIVKPEKGDLPPALDLEQYFNESATRNQFMDNAEAFLSKVKLETGITPMVYSRASFLKEKVCQANGVAPTWASKYLVWDAHWTYAYENVQPLQAAGWPAYTFWQYSGEKEHLDGITNQYGTPIAVDLDVFKGTLEDLQKLAGAPIPAPVKYTIMPGDTYEGIATKFNVNLAELLNTNPQLVMTGTVMTIPQSAGAGFASSGTSGESAVSTGAATTTGANTYSIKPGDTLWAIAQKFGVTVKALSEANHITDPNKISVGQVLSIPK